MAKIITKIDELLYGTLGTWKTDPLDFELKQDAKPILLGTHPVTKVHKDFFKGG